MNTITIPAPLYKTGDKVKGYDSSLRREVTGTIYTAHCDISILAIWYKVKDDMGRTFEMYQETIYRYQGED